jgi:lambda repressor-like predicted transcriptional regulator
MLKPQRSKDLPHLTSDELSDRDLKERDFRKELIACWHSHDFDIERGFHVIRAYSVELFEVIFSAYRKKKGYEAGWLPAIVNETLYRSLIVLEGNTETEFRDLQEVSKVLEKTILAHLVDNPDLVSPIDLYNVFPKLKPPLVGKQAAAYALAGIDMASASPLLLMAHAAAQAKRPDVWAPIPAEPKRRFPSQVKSESAARKVEDYMNKRGLNQTEFSSKAGMTDRTLRNFLRTGVARRSTLDGIASAMGVTKESLLS